MSWSSAPRPISSSSCAADAEVRGDRARVLHHPLRVVARLVLARIERGDEREEGVLVGPADVRERLAQLGRAVAHLALELLLVPLPRELDAALGERTLDRADEVGELRRLEQVVDRAAAQAVDGGLGVSVAGEHDHRRLRVLVPEVLEQPEPVLAGHLHVRDHQRRLGGAREIERHLRARGDHAVVALLFEENRDHVADRLVVVDDENPRRDGRERFQGRAIVRGLAPLWPHGRRFPVCSAIRRGALE